MMAYRPVGVDISKCWIDVAILVSKQFAYLRFDNCLSGFERFEAWLGERGIQKAHVCLEHTGRFHLAFSQWLFSRGHRVSVVAPFAVSRFGEGRLKRNTNDKVSAETLLLFLKERQPALWEPLGDDYDELRELVRYRQNIAKRLAVLRNQLASGPVSSFVQASLQAQITGHETERSRVEEEIQRLALANGEMKESIQVLQTMVGVGPTNAIKLLGEIGPWHRFPSSRALACYAGYLPCKAPSGTLNKRNTPATQWGNRHLREAVSSCVLTASRRQEFKDYYERLSARGKQRDARKARKRKFIEIVYGILKSRKPFDPKKAFPS